MRLDTIVVGDYLLLRRAMLPAATNGKSSAEGSAALASYAFNLA
jgi:hypothetical protein